MIDLNTTLLEFKRVCARNNANLHQSYVYKYILILWTVILSGSRRYRPVEGRV